MGSAVEINIEAKWLRASWKLIAPLISVDIRRRTTRRIDRDKERKSSTTYGASVEFTHIKEYQTNF
jgi:hypothetical protein